MVDKVINTIKANNMFQPGDKVIVAVSGGPDSICLLHILNSLREFLGIILVAAHVNHCLRGQEADKDESYVKEFCRGIGIECFVLRKNVHEVSKERGISCEMAGREVRYEFFSQLLKRLNAQKIAIAHNSNDQGETVLMRIIRGTGLDGLEGIKAVRDNIYVRPILDVARKEIEEYCYKNNLSPRIDKTNLESVYSRNKIRLELIPYIQKNFNPDIIDSLNRLASIVRVDNEYINNVSVEAYKKYCNKNKDKVIIIKEAFKLHEAILVRLLRMALRELKGNLYNFDKNHIGDIINIQKGETGKSIALPQKVRVINDYGNIQITSVSEKKPIVYEEDQYILKVNEKTTIKGHNLIVDLKIIEDYKKLNLKDKVLVKYFDYDKINGDIKLRYRKNGDRFTPIGMKGSKKLKDLFIDLKIPKEERDIVPLITFNDEIAWVVGYRLSDKFKVDNYTKNILQIIIEREEQYNAK